MFLRLLFGGVLTVIFNFSCVSKKNVDKCQYIRFLSSYNGGARTVGVYIGYDSIGLNNYLKNVNLEISDRIILLDSVSFTELSTILRGQPRSSWTEEILETTTNDYMIIDFLSENKESIDREILIDKPDVRKYFQGATKSIDQIKEQNGREEVRKLFNVYLGYANRLN